MRKADTTIAVWMAICIGFFLIMSERHNKQETRLDALEAQCDLKADSPAMEE